MFDDGQNNQNLGKTLGQSSASKIPPPFKLPVSQEIGEKDPDDILSEVNNSKQASPMFANSGPAASPGPALNSEPQKPAFFTPKPGDLGAQSAPLTPAPVAEQPGFGGPILQANEGQQAPAQNMPSDQILDGLEGKELSPARKIFIIIITVILVLALAGLGYWLYGKLSAEDSAINNLETEDINTGEGEDEEIETSVPPFGGISAPLRKLRDANEGEETVQDIKREVEGDFKEIAPIDTDGDGLTDEEELALGTDINKSDSDEDALSDRDEVEVYKTDPLNPDSDGDGYLDGDEIENGYDPKGPGRLLNLP